jgi:DNA mismatch repair protein MutL
MPIRQLPQSLINKIAAGEVIERPASVVKELMENSVDAGATRIDVAIEAGGVDLIRVSDNGCGIPAEELPLAVASHATSKIATADDLFRVGTLGFRGEALASIAEVSRLLLRSRTPGASGGAELEVVGGLASPATPCGCPPGTTIEVRNLFFNTPVRRKFLRATATELGHVSEAFLRIALALPQIHLTLRHNDRTVFDLPATSDWLPRIAAALGRALAEQLIWVTSADGPVRLAGYVAHPSESRGNNRSQYLFLNGRHIRDRSLQHALGEAYRGLLMTGRFPVALLSLTMPPEQVDVNVHPTKLEVRFQNSGQLYSQLLATLRTKFLATDLTARVQTPAEADPAEALDSQQAAGVRQQVVDWAKGAIRSWGSGGGVSALPAAPLVFPPRPQPLELTRLERSWAPAAEIADEEMQPHSLWSSAGVAAGSNEEPRSAPAWPPGLTGPHPSAPAATPAADASPAEALGREPRSEPLRALQIHDRYLVTENEEGVVVIDQHALHERILYEQLRQRVANGAIESQSLLVPEPIDLSPSEAAAVLEHRELLAQLGMRVEPFGGDTVLVNSYPAMLANVDPVEVLGGLLEPLISGGKPPDRRDLLDELLHMIACKAAVKAGDRLAPEEIKALLDHRHLVDDSHHCPHGRPTELVFSREELDKQFGRI